MQECLQIFFWYGVLNKPNTFAKSLKAFCNIKKFTKKMWQHGRGLVHSCGLKCVCGVDPWFATLDRGVPVGARHMICMGKLFTKHTFSGN